MGRNIWQSDNPVAMIKAVRAIVHGNSNVNQAYDLYKKISNEKPNRNNKKPNKPKTNRRKSFVVLSDDLAKQKSLK